MKLAFTTLGCPEWDMDTIISRAVEYGFDGVDFRGYLGEFDIFRLPEFATGIKDTSRRFADAGLEMPCFSSSVCMFPASPENQRAVEEEIKHYAELCGPFKAPFIRLFGGAIGDIPRDEAVGIAVAYLNRLLAIAETYGVQLLVETHDDWVCSTHLKAVLEKIGSDAAGVIWDTHHPYRLAGESPAETCAALGPWIRYTHWKDSRPKQDGKPGYQPCLFGEGDVPLQEIYSCLRNLGYDGYLTLEWEKVWSPDIEEPEIVFPGYVQVMREMISRKE